jgi:hypothetical protein
VLDEDTITYVIEVLGSKPLGADRKRECQELFSEYPTCSRLALLWGECEPDASDAQLALYRVARLLADRSPDPFPFDTEYSYCALALCHAKRSEFIEAIRVALDLIELDEFDSAGLRLLIGKWASALRKQIEKRGC